MGQQLNVFLNGGTGTITLDPEPDSDGFYNSVGSVDITVDLDNGFTFVNWTKDGTELGTSTTLTYTFNRSDATIIANATGVAEADFDYGLRLYSEYVDDQNRKSRLEIEEKDYVGEPELVDVKNVRYKIGTTDNFPDEIFMKSSLNWDFQIEKDNPDLDFLLTLDPRKFRVKWYRDYTDASTYGFYWVGYLKTEFLEKVEYRSTYDISVVATDGISDFNGYLSPTTALNLDSGITVLAQIINDSFKDGLPISESVRVFETRMDHGVGDSLFEQFTINKDALIEDDVTFQQSGSLLIYNQGKTLLKALETLLSSWICRVFQWDGVWYIIRIWEYRKGNLTLNNFDKTGDRIGNNSLTLDQEFNCIGNPSRRGETGFTRFNVSLKLGSINRPESRSILSEPFDLHSFLRVTDRGRPYTGTTLSRWDYINSQVWTESVGRTNEYAGVERVSEPNTNTYFFIRFWGTADGVNDPLLSSVKWRNNQNETTVKDADVLSIYGKFRILRRGEGWNQLPPAGSHKAAMQVKIGTKYLDYDGDTTFTWVDTPSLILFPVETFGDFNIIEIKDIVVPLSGEIEFSLMQLITVTGGRHGYIIDWDDIEINLSRNDALAYKEIKAKAVTDSPHSNVFSERETFIGDAITNLSSSALILKDVAETPVSENWTREELEEEEEEPLLSVLLSDMVNIFGKNNYMLTATIKESDAGNGIDFRKGLKYNGKDFVLTSASLDDRSGIWNIQAFQLEPEN